MFRLIYNPQQADRENKNKKNIFTAVLKFLVVVVIIIIIIIYLTANRLSPGGSGYYHVHKYEIRI